MEWTTVLEDEYSTAESTLREITADNTAFRESSEIHVKCFDIEIDEPLCEMRDDTKLVLVDIPGINEAGAGGNYRAYVKDKWDTFDCVVVVMDGRQGANTEEQVNLLEFVKKNNEEKKDVPIIILCNKVDDPEDEEQRVLVKEMCLEIQRVFEVTSREKALDDLLLGRPTSSSSSMYPVFIPTSAIHAFIYQTASLMTLEQFKKKFDKDLIEVVKK